MWVDAVAHTDALFIGSIQDLTSDIQRHTPVHSNSILRPMGFSWNELLQCLTDNTDSDIINKQAAICVMTPGSSSLIIRHL